MSRAASRWWGWLAGRPAPFAPPAGMTLGHGAEVRGLPRVKLIPGARIEVGARAVINSNPVGYHAGMPFPVTLLADRPGASIVIGEGSRLHGCCLHAWLSIRMGRKCLVAAGAQILDAHGHAEDLRFARVRDRLADAPAEVVIGDFCWLGLGALVLKGARLGEGCVVAAHSVVMAGDYPPFSLIAGTPARVVKTLAPEEVLAEDAPLEPFSAQGLQSYDYRGGRP